MNLRPLRLLLVGLGNRGGMWSEIILAHERVELAAAVDPDPLRWESLRLQSPDLPIFPDLKTALSEIECDGVLLATPPDGHLEQARIIFAAGLPLLAEKPLSLDLGEARAIVQLAEDREIPLSVGLNFRYLPVSRRVRDLIAAETYGEPGFALFSYLRNRDGRAPGLNKYPLTMDHPMLLEQTIHHFDLIRFCYGREVESIFCRTYNPGWSHYRYDSNVVAHLSLTGGLEVTYLGTWIGGHNRLEFCWRTDCSRGVIVQRELFGDLAVASTSADSLSVEVLPECRPFYDDSAALLSEFVAAVRGERSLPCSGMDHLLTLALCFAAIESSETGKLVRMDDFCRRHAIDPHSGAPL